MAIDDLLTDLDRCSMTLALADDLVAMVPGLWKLDTYLALLEERCRAYGFTINKAKSAIIQVRLKPDPPDRPGPPAPKTPSQAT